MPNHIKRTWKKTISSGYIGRGFLTAAVAGNVFASPPSKHVQDALEATRGNGKSLDRERKCSTLNLEAASHFSKSYESSTQNENSGGAVLFVINYTGDRLNFGLAAERFKAENGVVEVSGIMQFEENTILHLSIKTACRHQ